MHEGPGGGVETNDAMNRNATTKSPRSSTRRGGALAAMLGAALGVGVCVAPVASAHATETTTADAASSMDLRSTLALEQRRMTLGMLAWMGGGFEHAALRISAAHSTWSAAMTFTMVLDASEVETDSSDEDETEAEPETEPETDNDETEETSDDATTSRRFDYSEDTNDPLAGL